MGNAPQEVKDGATVVTKTNNENGAGQAVGNLCPDLVIRLKRT